MHSYLTAVLLCVTLSSAFAYHELQKCPAKQNGKWSDWLRWGPCSQTCGKGAIQIRHRFCDNPEPKYGGAKCEGSSIEQRDCTLPECPVKGVLGDYEVIQECVDPCKGHRVKQRVCKQPDTFSGKPSCYTCPQDYDDTIKEACNAPGCRSKVGNQCQHCTREANIFASQQNSPGFVGFACRTLKERCADLKGGIKDMYESNDWFFLHCSPDGPWCKPCATRTLVYNKKCGQCEATRKGPCTGPEKWRNDASDLDDELW